jgi:hypothetical protein
MTFDEFIDRLDKKPATAKLDGIVDALPPVLAFLIICATIAAAWIVWAVTPPRFLR